MQTNRWGVFLCDSDSSLNIDIEKFGELAPIVTVATGSDEDILTFAKHAEEQGWEQVIISNSEAPERFQEHLKGKTLHFLDLKEKCFLPHTDSEQAHNKALRIIKTEMQLAKIRARISVPINLLRAGSRIVIYTDSPDGLKLANMLKDLDDLMVIIPPGTKGVSLPDDIDGKQADLISVDGRLGSLNIVVEPTSTFARLTQKRVKLQADQLIILTETIPLDIKKRTGVYLLSQSDNLPLDEVAEQVRGLMGTFNKPEHLAYDADICAGGDKEIETCGRCIPACPYSAISRDKESPLRIKVNHMACEGCGACASACPTSALKFTEPSPEEIYTQIASLLTNPEGEQAVESPPVILFHCEEMGKKVLQQAGQVPLPYSSSVLPIEVPCLRFVSESNMLAALQMGAAGVGLLGCENCPNGERELLYQKYEFSRLILHHFELGEERLRIITAEEGEEAEIIDIINRFASQLPPSIFTPDGKSPRQTSNRTVLAQVFGGFIEQTEKEPGGIKLAPDPPFGYADIDDKGCTLCRSCVNICPTNAFKFEDESNSLHFKHINCVGCKLCETICPENVISIRSELVLEKSSLDFVKVAEDEMIKCAKCDKPYINRKALEMVESKLFSIDSLKNTFSGSRKNILRMCPDCRAVDAMLDVNQGWEP